MTTCCHLFRAALHAASPLALAVGLSACSSDALPPPPPPASDLAVRHFVVFFAFDKSDLDAAARRAIADAAAAIKAGGAVRVLVSGHADAAGPAAYNQALSERRAAVVSRALIDAGVNPTTVLVTAYGESRLLHPTADGIADPRNRRVEVVFQRAATPAIVSRGGPCPYGTVNGTTVTYTPEEFVAYRTCMEALHGD
jgi:hypothetical protein